jgi:predicted phosphodiesterase
MSKANFRSISQEITTVCGNCDNRSTSSMLIESILLNTYKQGIYFRFPVGISDSVPY